MSGRSSNQYSKKRYKAYGPPKDEPWFWTPCELAMSVAWRERSINCVRLMEFLQIEHRNHRGLENGYLAATYDQLVEYGLTRSEIRAAIEEAEFLGLIRYERGGRWNDSNQPSRYRITFITDRAGALPTNDWKRRTRAEIRDWKSKYVARKKARQRWRKEQKAGSESGTTVVRFAELPREKAEKP